MQKIYYRQYVSEELIEIFLAQYGPDLKKAFEEVEHLLIQRFETDYPFLKGTASIVDYEYNFARQTYCFSLSCDVDEKQYMWELLKS